jgi:hypothetical protein
MVIQKTIPNKLTAVQKKSLISISNKIDQIEKLLTKEPKSLQKMKLPLERVRKSVKMAMGVCK